MSLYYLLETVNVNLFGKRVFADVIKDLDMKRSSGIIRVWPQSSIVFLKDTEESGRRKGRRQWDVGGRRTWSRQPQTRRGAESPEGLRWERARRHLGLRPLASKITGEYVPIVLCYQVCGDLFRQPQETNVHCDQLPPIYKFAKQVSESDNQRDLSLELSFPLKHNFGRQTLPW